PSGDQPSTSGTRAGSGSGNAVRVFPVERSSTWIPRPTRSIASRLPSGAKATWPMPEPSVSRVSGASPGCAISRPPSRVTPANWSAVGDHVHACTDDPNGCCTGPPAAETTRPCPNASHRPSKLNRAGGSAPVATRVVCLQVPRSTSLSAPSSIHATSPNAADRRSRALAQWDLARVASVVTRGELLPGGAAQCIRGSRTWTYRNAATPAVAKMTRSRRDGYEVVEVRPRGLRGATPEAPEGSATWTSARLVPPRPRRKTTSVPRSKETLRQSLHPRREDASPKAKVPVDSRSIPGAAPPDLQHARATDVRAHHCLLRRHEPPWVSWRLPALEMEEGPWRPSTPHRGGISKLSVFDRLFPTWAHL